MNSGTLVSDRYIRASGYGTGCSLFPYAFQSETNRLPAEWHDSFARASDRIRTALATRCGCSPNEPFGELLRRDAVPLEAEPCREPPTLRQHLLRSDLLSSRFRQPALETVRQPALDRADNPLD